MSHQPTAAEQHQNLVAQERNLLAEKARLSEQLEAINAQLNFVRTSLQCFSIIDGQKARHVLQNEDGRIDFVRQLHRRQGEGATRIIQRCTITIAAEGLAGRRSPQHIQLVSVVS